MRCAFGSILSPSISSVIPSSPKKFWSSSPTASSKPTILGGRLTLNQQVGVRYFNHTFTLSRAFRNLA